MITLRALHVTNQCVVERGRVSQWGGVGRAGVGRAGSGGVVLNAFMECGRSEINSGGGGGAGVWWVGVGWMGWGGWGGWGGVGRRQMIAFMGMRVGQVGQMILWMGMRSINRAVVGKSECIPDRLAETRAHTRPKSKYTDYCLTGSESLA